MWGLLGNLALSFTWSLGMSYPNEFAASINSESKGSYIANDFAIFLPLFLDQILFHQIGNNEWLTLTELSYL